MQSATLANPKWRPLAELPRKPHLCRSTFRFLDGGCVHTAPIKFAAQENFRQYLWCSRRASQVFNHIGQKFDLDFGVHILEPLGVEIFE